jgi:hypothetical protein
MKLASGDANDNSRQQPSQALLRSRSVRLTLSRTLLQHALFQLHTKPLSFDHSCRLLIGCEEALARPRLLPGFAIKRRSFHAKSFVLLFLR